MNALSPDTRRLLGHARNDGPSEASRRRIFGGVLAQTAVAAAVAPGATQTGGGIVVTKAALGVLLGAAVTVGLAATLLVAGARGPAMVGPDPVAVADRGPTSLSLPPAALQPIMGSSPRSEGKVTDVVIAAPSVHTGSTPVHVNALPSEDPMEREARLVAEARAALLRGDPATAVAKVHAAQAIPSRQMEPEELRVLAKALRALGDDKGASRAQTDLVMRYPGEASP